MACATEGAARRSAGALVLACLAVGCSAGPEFISLGQTGSPCATHADCDPGSFCVSVDDQQFCTPACVNEASCPVGYACSRAEGICRPTLDGVCRARDQRCGPSFEACCEGHCVMFESFGSFCTSPCDFSCTTGCCASSGGRRVCAPPSFC